MCQTQLPRGVRQVGISISLISRSELLLFTLWLLLLLWYREYTLGCVHLKRDCLELGHGSPAIYCSETHVGNAGTAWSRVQWILSNAGHEPELQSYTAAVSLLSLSPVCMLNCLSGSGAEAAAQSVRW